MTSKATTGGNWWDKLGKPQYGGELVIRANRNIHDIVALIIENIYEYSFEVYVHLR